MSAVLARHLGSRMTSPIRNVRANTRARPAFRLFAQVPAGQFAANFTQPELDLGGVLLPYPQQNLVSGGTGFKFLIREAVNHVRLNQAHRFTIRRCGEQMVDNHDQPVVEITVRIAEILISLLKQWIKANI